MAPITQETVDGLKDVIHKLESRVADLESRLVHGGSPASTSKSIAEQFRIILIGPPGAGKSEKEGHSDMLPMSLDN